MALITPLKPEDFDLLAENPAFAAIMARVGVMIEDHRTALEADVSPEGTWKVRGACAALRRVLELREILKGEAEEAISKR